MSEEIIKANNIDIWYETFGAKTNQALLLIMGGCCQGILWPTEFCERLAKAGFYVIRYDNRDVGLSTCFDFEKHPYNLLDMAKDAIGLLDYLKVKKTVILGLSMGGPTAELIAAHYPSRVKALALMASSCDFRPMNLAYAGLPEEKGSLSRTKEIYLNWMQEFLKKSPTNPDEILEQRLECWRILNGYIVPFEEDLYRNLHLEFLARTRDPEAIKNHVFVCKNSEDLVKHVPTQVKVPTIVFHGSEDPIFPPDHGVALADAIDNAKYIPIEGMGHLPNRHFYDLIINEMKEYSCLSVRI